MEHILSRKRQLPHLKLMLLYIYGVKWLIFIIFFTGIRVGHVTCAKPLLRMSNSFKVPYSSRISYRVVPKLAFSRGRLGWGRVGCLFEGGTYFKFKALRGARTWSGALIWSWALIRAFTVCAAPKGMVFSRFSHKQGIDFSHFAAISFYLSLYYSTEFFFIRRSYFFIMPPSIHPRFDFSPA